MHFFLGALWVKYRELVIWGNNTNMLIQEISVVLSLGPIYKTEDL